MDEGWEDGEQRKNKQTQTYREIRGRVKWRKQTGGREEDKQE